MNDWKCYQLKNLGVIKTGKTPPSSCKDAFSNTGVPFVTPKDMNGVKTIFKTERYLSKIGLDLIKNYLVPKNSIAVSCIGSDMGKAYLLSEDSVTNQQINTLIVNKNHNFEFIYYKLSIMQDYLKSIASGSATPILNKSHFSEIEIELPDLDTQNNFVEKLKYLDKKIQLNTQINQTLEEIAQALFKSWFVDFDPVRAKVQALSDGLSLEQAELAAMQAISGKTPEELTALSQTQPDRYAELAETAKAFPCEMVEVDGVEVPKGWEYKPADELFDIGIGKTPPRKETEWFSTNPDDMQWISIKDMGNSGVFITESSEFLTNQAVDKFNIRKIPENTVLLSFKLTIGRVSITTRETTTNEAIAHFKITDKSFLTTEYLYLFFQQFDFNSLGSTSSIATAVNSKTIKGIEILIPNEELIKAFQMKISNIFAQIKNLTMENKNLVETRDLLLPKLLNGEI